MMVIPALVILLIYIFPKLRVCFKAKTISDIIVSPQNDEINVETMVGSQFDVFLSFTGEDTRKGFTDHLYEVLRQHGVSTFRDSEGLERGEKIEKLLEYIEKSKICIPVISKNYAHSKWCLKELAKMMECKKKVIPVFFKVDPNDVKNQRGCFADGFKKHKGKVKQEELIKWREALTEVGNISGYTLKDTNEYEGKLVQMIVKKILDKVKPHHLHVGKYIIGHESHLAELMRILDLKSNNVRMIGIYGMGGIGKTTLVRAVHNRISSEFEACSFHSNVREESLQSKGIVSLQKQLLKDVFNEQCNITDESNGTKVIIKKICTKKVLIILDDVDSKRQLDALVGSRDWFGVESRIIITTRDRKPLIEHGVKGDELYELRVLSHDDSMKLFCYHAFGKEKPPREEYATMCDEAVSFIKGLPLALEVLGLHFFGLETEKQWRGWLARLKDCPDEKIIGKLKLSYDSLQDSEKKVFLDIACFFVGKRRRRKFYFDYFELDEMKAFWEDCGFYPEPAIEVLKHKSLIKTFEYCDNWKGKVKRHVDMHDQIRDMGRKIVEDEGKECSRLWNDRKVIKTLPKQKVPSATIIEGIMFQGKVQASDFSAPCFQEMDRLRLLHVQGAKFEGFPHFPEDLKWLGLPCCQHFQMPTSISIPKEVTVLDLHDNDDVANVLLVEHISRSMEFDKLKVLDLSWTRITTTPDFSMMPCLVKLTFEQCKELVEIQDSVGQLKSLEWLSLEGCSKLPELPDTTCQLISLEFLSLYQCENLLYLPKQLGNMSSLQYFDLRGVSSHIKSLPDSMRKLHVLEHLLVYSTLREISFATFSEDLVAASKLTCYSVNILDVLPDLCCRRKTQLELIDNTVEELTETFIRWENLESLMLNCSSLKSLPVEIGKLPKLKALEVYSDNLILVDDAIPLASMEKLVLKCAVLEYVSSFKKKAQNLKHLTLETKKMEVLPDWIGSWSKLETLQLRGCKIMESKVPSDHLNTPRIPFVFENLKILSLDGDPMNITSSFSYLPYLEKLMLTNCKELIEVHESIGSLKKLQFLKVIGCTLLERLPDNICELRSLKCLDLKGCISLSSLPEQLVDHMEMLEELCLDRTGIISLPTALRAKLPTSLRSLSIKNCQSLKSNIPWSLISCLESLKELHVIGRLFKGMSNNNFFELKSTGSLRASTSWEFMDALPISCCESVLKLCFTNERIEKLTDSIGRFEHVEYLTLRCKMLKALPNCIGQLKNLKDLTLKCHTMAIFDMMYLSESLVILKVECVEFEPLPFSSITLENSTAGSCKNVKTMAPFIGSVSQDQSNKSTVMKKLRRLDICAKQITVTPDFCFAPYLEELTLRNCEMLTEVHDSVGTLENLKSLLITGCNALEGLPHTISHLTLLERLELSQHFDLSSLPENLGLRETGIKSILSSIEKLTQLRSLNLQKSCPGRGNFKWIWFQNIIMLFSGSCSELVAALSSSRLHSVSMLVITYDQIEVLPDCIAQMQNLKYLELKCQSLKALPKWIGQLQRLRTFALECDNIPPFIDEMCSWEHIEIRLRVSCLNLEPVTYSIGERKNVKSLKLECSSLDTLPDCIASLGGLRDLSLSGCKNIKHLPNSMRQLGSLELLDLSETGIAELPPWLGCFTNLTHLKLRNSTQNDVLLSGLSHLTSLEVLDLSGSNFKSLPSCISSFSRLEWLDVSGCKQLHTIPHLSSSVLRRLDASNCTNLRALPDFSNLQSLKYLFLGGCNSLECIPGFETIAGNIEYLELPGPSGGIQCSNLGTDFKNKVFMQAHFRNLSTFKTGGNLIAGPHSGQQSMSFLFPDVRFSYQKRCSSLKLILDGKISSPVDVAVVMEDDHVLFETRLQEDDFDNDDKGSKTFSIKGRDDQILKPLEKRDEKEILEHLEKGSETILVSTDVSKLSRVELEANYSRYL